MAAATQPSAGAPADPAPPPDAATPFRVLGPLEVHAARPVPVTARRQQIVLALLLLESARGVTLDTLVSAVWGATPPATARSQVQTAVSALRRSLDCAGLGRRIRMQGARYTLDLAHGELDLHVFDDLAARGRAAAADGRPDAARAAFRRALDLWRGDPLAGVDSPQVQARLAPVAERRFTVLEACFDAELRLGMHHEAIGEIAALAAEFPLRERPAEQLMTALYRCGRQAEALAAYRSVRRTFIDELGIELSPALRRLELAILNGSADLDQPRTRSVAPTVPAPVPQQLPARLADFTGREAHLRDLCAYLAPGAGAADVPLAVLTGAPGAGKSALAVEAAHILAPVYPDGQLHAALPVGDPAHAAAQLMERFLRALGVPAASVPRNRAERAALYQGVLAERRVLVVVEDAVQAAQIRELLPESPGCALLVTARGRCAAPAGAHTVEVAAPSIPDGVEMLAAMAGWERVGAEPSVAIELTELCDGLPLALRVAAARLAAHPHWRLGDLTARLRDERRRLTGLAHQDLDLRATLRGAHQALPEPARVLLARLGGLPARHFAAWAAAPLLDAEPADAAGLLAALADVRLVEPAGGTGPAARYRMPGLVRLFAAERLAERSAAAPDPERDALRRVLDARLTLTEEAVLRLGGAPAPGLHHPPRRPLDLATVTAVLGDPAGWYAAEHDALRAAVRHAADAGESELCARLAVAVCSLAATQRAFEDWRDCATHALTAARQAGDRLGEAALLYSLGALDEQQHRDDDARARLRGALGVFDQLGADAWRELAAQALARLDRGRAAAAGFTVRPLPLARPRAAGPAPAAQGRPAQGQFGKAAVRAGTARTPGRTPAPGASRDAAAAARHRPVAPAGPFPHRHRNDPMEER